jgi:trimeric autotransporter adhesin
MNKAYRSVWNEVTGTWVAVQENATSRGKRSSARAVKILNAAVILGAGSFAASAAYAETTCDPDSSSSTDCEKTVATTSPSTPATVVPVMLTATSTGSGVDTTGMEKIYTSAAIYSQVKGFANNSGSSSTTDLPRAYAKGSIAIGSNTLVEGNAGVALGTQAYAKAEDSVALGAGSIAGEANTVSVGTDGTQSFYISGINDNKTYTTLFHPEANTRRIVNMAAGQKDTDAVNVSQIKGVTTALGGGAGVNEDGSIQAPSYGVAGDTYSDVGSALQAVDEASQAGLAEAVKYDSTAHDKVTFGGVDTSHGPVQLSNVANARQDNDAVNLWQLKAAGLTVDSSGNLTNSFVAYDNTSKTSVWFGGFGSGTPPVVLRNVAAGTVSASSTDAVNGAQLHGQAESMANVLGGDTKVNPDGTLSTPNFDFGTGTTYSDVDSALNAVAELAKGGAADAVVYDTSDHDKLTLGGRKPKGPVQITNVAKATDASDAVNLAQLQEAGLEVDPSGNVKNSFVAYDDAKKDSVTFGGKNPNAQVALHNVAKATSASDAVNLGQLQEAGLDVDTSGNVKNSFVAYDDAKKDSVTFGGKNPNAQVALHNVAAGVQDADAVNVSQLKAAGLDVDPSGNVTNSFVAYDDAKKDSVTLGGKNPGAPVALHNVAKATSAGDAVNLAQLQEAGLDVDPSGNVKNSFVAYDDEKKDSVTFGGKNPGAPVALHNVAKATSASDAVNLGQLQEAGLDVDPSGNVRNSFVAYDDAKKDSVTFGGKNPNAQVALHNVAAGAQDADAVNVSQLKAAGLDLDPSGNVKNSFVAYDDSTKSQVTLGGVGGTVLSNVKAGLVSAASTDAVNGSQLYGLAASTASALGGDTKVNPNGTISTPNFDFGTGKTYGDVDSALNAVAELARGGAADAVVYDTSDHDKLTLGGRKSTVPVQLTNVAKATEASDAVNLAQLQEAGLDVDPSGNVRNSFVAYDDAKKDSVTFGGKNPGAPVALHNVAKATSAGDAVNLAQLQEAGLDVDPSGNVKNSFVAYDDEKKDSVTFGGKNPNAQVALHNVAAGAQDLDAVNVLQLKAAGLDLDPSGNVKNSFVAYDDEKKDSVTFGGKNPNAQVALHNVAAGAQDADAVNVSQLKAAGLDVDPSGNVKNSFVAYDDAKKDSVTLGGKNPGAPVALHNVAKATSAGDAVNLAQLQEAGLDVDPSGNVKNSFVAYDDTSKTSVTFGGTTPGAQAVALHNVAAGAKDLDAVNVLQLKAAGLDLDPSGNVKNSFVAYDNALKSQITLGGSGGTVITNVKAGSITDTSTDAVNGSQLYALEQQMNSSGLGLVMQDSSTRTITVGANADGKLVDFTGTSGARKLTGVAASSVDASSSDAVNGSQLYGTAQSTASALGGGATVKSDGTIAAPSYTVGGTTVNNVGAAIENLDGRVTDLQNGVAASVANTVQYDSTAHDQVTLGGTNANTPTVKLTNLTDADLSESSTDAVTGSQLYTTNQKLADLGQAIENVGNTGSQYISANSSNGAASATGSNSIAAGGGATASGANSTAIGDMANASASNSVALGANSVADRANSVSVGAAGSERQITNVADGKAPTDAVNMRQLQSVQSSMTSLQRGAYGGVAAATALTMIPDVDAGKTIAVGIGTANYKGYQATALGASARVTQNLKVKVGAGYSAGNTTVGGGMSYQW